MLVILPIYHMQRVKDTILKEHLKISKKKVNTPQNTELKQALKKEK